MVSFALTCSINLYVNKLGDIWRIIERAGRTEFNESQSVFRLRVIVNIGKWNHSILSN